MDQNRHKFFDIPYLISLVSTVLALGMYAYIGWFNRLLGDSLCSYYYAERLGLLRSIWYWRITWSGRYSAYGFDWLTTKLFPPNNIPLFITFFIVLWVIVNIATIFLMLKEKLDSRKALTVASLLGTSTVFLTLAISPYIQQSFFWIDGFRAYTLPIIVLTFYIGFYSLFIKNVNSKISIRFASLLSFLFFFFSGGLSETFAAVQFAFLIFCIFYYRFTETASTFDKFYAILISGWIGAITAIFVIFTAPGNAVRQSFFPQSPDLFTLISISLNAYAVFLTTIFTTSQKILALLGGVLLALWAGMLLPEKLPMHNRRIAFLLLGTILLPFASFPPGVYGYSEPPPDRVLIIAVFFLVMFLMSFSFRIGNLLGQGTQTKQGLQIFFSIAAATALFSASAINIKIFYDDRTEYIEYAKYWDNTDVIIKKAKAEGKEVVTVQTIPNWAGMDLLSIDNRNHWVNECYSFFYGIQVFGVRP